MARIDGIDKIVLYLFWNQSLWLFYVFYEELNIRLNPFEFIFDKFFLFSNEFFQCSNIVLR